MISDEEKLKRARAIDIRDINLSARVLNVFNNETNIKTVGDLMDTNWRDLMRLRNFGVKSLAEVKYVMRALGVRMKGEPCPTCQGRGWVP